MKVIKMRFSSFSDNVQVSHLPVYLEDLDEDAMDRGEIVSFEDYEAEIACALWEQDIIGSGYYDDQEGGLPVAEPDPDAKLELAREGCLVGGYLDRRVQ